MARSPRTPKPRLTRDASRLVSLCKSLHASGSRLEDEFWESQIGEVLKKIFKAGNDNALESALDHLSQSDTSAFEVLLEQAETKTESYSVLENGQVWDILLMTAPLTVWTRYQLPAANPLPTRTEASLLAALQETILAPGVKIELLPQMVSPDEMPRSFSETATWMHRLGQRAITGKSPFPDMHRPMDPPGLLADSRHLVFAIATKPGEPFLRWQISEADGRETCLSQWQEATRPLFAALMPGCQFDVLLPDAYYVSMRDADKQIRPIAIKAATHWLEAALSLPASSLRASVIGLGDTKIQEYRVGFSTKGSNDVVYGTVWPLFEPAEEGATSTDGGIDTIDEIAAVLKESGIGEVRRIPGIGLLEYCEDCAAPLFPNPLGELVHAELPEEAVNAPVQFH